MKKFRKLIPALCMLLISAMLMGTSTYAWFSMNTTVTATGMQVQATTSKNLVISNSEGTTYGVSASASFSGGHTLNPCSTSTKEGVLSAGKFFYVKNPETIIYSNGQVQNSTEFEAIPTVTPNAAHNYVATHNFNIKVDGKNGDQFTKVYVKSISVKDGSNNPDSAISQALRVAVVSTTHTYLFVPVENGSKTYKGIIGEGLVSSGNVINSAEETIANVGTDATIGTVGTTAVSVTVYIWYEGQDPACTSANSISVENLSISIEFEGSNT